MLYPLTQVASELYIDKKFSYRREAARQMHTCIYRMAN